MLWEFARRPGSLSPLSLHQRRVLRCYHDRGKELSAFACAFLNRDSPDAADCDVREGRVEVLRSGLRGRTPSKRRRAMEGPSARTHGAMPERREPRRQAGPNRSPWFSPLLPKQKRAAVKAEPVEPAHTDNGYVHRKTFYPTKNTFNSWSCVLHDERQLAGDGSEVASKLPPTVL